MSSIDQAFVKAFSRRNRAAHLAAEPPSPAPIDQEELGALKLDPSVAASATLWVDSAEDTILRSDSPAVIAPKPHLEAVNESATSSFTTLDQQAEPLQHIHTAYANSGLSKIEPTALAAGVENDASQSLRPEASAAATIAPTAPTETTRTSETDSRVTTTRIDPPIGVAPTPVRGNSIESPRSPVPDPAPVNDPPDGQETAAAVEIATPLTPFQAAWEVDVFDVPKTVADLFFDGKLFQLIAERMLDAVDTGLHSMIVTSAKPGAGRSSVAMGIAMAAGAAGVRVALVDGDAQNPTLADDLRLDLQHGWIDSIRSGLPIKEVAIHAIEDGVTLIPLMPPQQSSPATAFEMARLMELLKGRFELVIVDGPAATSPSVQQYVNGFDSAVIVHDKGCPDTTSIHDMSDWLRSSGVQGIGIVENFV